MEVEVKEVELFKGGAKKPEYLAINPKGRIPLLVEGDFILSESASIMRYLCDSREGPNHLFPRDDLKKRAEIDALLDFSGTSFRPAFCYDLIWKVMVPEMQKKDLPSEETRKQIFDKVHSNLDIIEQTLEQAKDGYLTGAEFTIADV